MYDLWNNMELHSENVCFHFNKEPPIQTVCSKITSAINYNYTEV